MRECVREGGSDGVSEEGESKGVSEGAKEGGRMEVRERGSKGSRECVNED